jgi:tetratricopeptide (TPR) repeat protein
MQDLHGLALSTPSQDAADAFNRTLRAYVGYRVDMSDHLGAALRADPGFALAHCAKGYFMMLAYNAGMVQPALEAHGNALRLAPGATPREQQHVSALGAWIAGDLEKMLDVWEEILAQHPTDVLALRLAHFNYFWLGRREDMRASVERVLHKWPDSLEAYSTLLACLAFGREECGDYAAAERAGRRAVELNPADVWATHAVAHVLEMQGRQKEGIDWLASLEGHWQGVNNIAHHLWWHRAMFHLERREFDAVLELYDRRFRDLASPLVQKMPDLYIDIQNAASMLFRLERQGVRVGARWEEIADKAEARTGDCLSAFTLPHWMMALAATGRGAAAARLLAGMREYAAGAATTSRVVRDVAVPACEAVLAHRRGDHPQALALLRPIVERLSQLGGSHAQQDVLKQLYLDAALKAERDEDVRSILVRAARAYAMPPARRVGYEEAARRFAG